MFEILRERTPIMDQGEYARWANKWCIRFDRSILKHLDLLRYDDDVSIVCD